uniref:Putative secreted peptide n=1 Tax=Anopheles braziliensis TaxID=58242 RepID=A0A2M3ZMG7_9DIPT
MLLQGFVSVLGFLSSARGLWPFGGRRERSWGKHEQVTDMEHATNKSGFKSVWWDVVLGLLVPHATQNTRTCKSLTLVSKKEEEEEEKEEIGTFTNVKTWKQCAIHLVAMLHDRNAKRTKSQITNISL